ncbi:hypothetical protein QYM36_009584, partial [Artemia franciscana]
MEEPQEARTPRVEISTILSGSEEGSSPEEERKQLPCGRLDNKSGAKNIINAASAKSEASLIF